MTEDPVARAKNWSDLNKLLFADSWQDDLKRHRSDYAFRGVTCSSYKLTTSLIRLGGEKYPGHGPKLEQMLLRSFKKYAYQDNTRNYNVWDWLSLAQHHGLPTRLLDWTNSPLIALHFATYDCGSSGESYDKDAAVWCVRVDKTHHEMPTTVHNVLRRRGAFIFTTEMLEEVATSLDDLNKIADMTNFVMFFEPPSLDARIINQFGFFSVMPNAETALDDWLAQHPDLYRKIVIPARLKWEIRNKLDQMNITERVLMPGLDGLCTWLKRYYSRYPENAENTEDKELE